MRRRRQVYAALLGAEPQTDGEYYVGFDAAAQHIGLAPGGGPQGMTSPVAYWHVQDLEAKLTEVTAAGATVKEPSHESRWRPPGGHCHRPRWQRPRAASGPMKEWLDTGGDLTMAESTATRKGTQQSAKGTAKKSTNKAIKRTAGKTSQGFTPEERAAMKERAKELKAAATRAEGEKALLAAIAKMPGPDRALGKRLHALITTTAPDLTPKTWYGMPAYAKDDNVVCFFQSADKFKSRYATFGFNDAANLDQGAMWPTSFALREWTPAVEAKIGKLIRKAVSGD